MATPGPSKPLATAADLAALPEDLRAEVIDGVVVEKASPSFEHGDAQSTLAALFKPVFGGSRGGGRPGGWWIATEVEVELAEHEVYRPDLVGWRRDRVPTRPSGRPVRIIPDWICEILSATHARHDLVTKLRVFERCRVPHYWIVDPERQVLMVYRFQDGANVLALTAQAGESVHAEPFDALCLSVGLIFGDEPEEQ